MLLSTFTFEHTEKEIKWNLAAIIYPSVGDEKSPSLPLKVGLASKVYGGRSGSGDDQF